jgi:glutamine synthetase adenylyltransferase
MDILHRVIRKIHADPDDSTASTLRALIKSLDAGAQFDINQLYQLGYSDFSMAMELMKQWRLDRFRYERGWASRASTDPAMPERAPAWLESMGASLDLRR